MTRYVRDYDKVFPALFENPAGQILTKKPCKIQVPVRFSEIGLGEIGIRTFTYGLFALILDSGLYMVMNVCAIVELNPYKLTKIMIDDVEYHEFHFDANQVVIKAVDLVKNPNIIYNVMDELVFKGKVPWYADYEDVGKLFDTAKYHAGSDVGQSLETMEFVASMVCRSRMDLSKYIRSVAKTYADTVAEKIGYVPLKSVFYSVKSTVNKLAGSYFADGVVSALVQPAESVENIEKVLRA